MYRATWDADTYISDTDTRGAYECTDPVQFRRNGVSVTATTFPTQARSLSTQLRKTTLVKLTLAVDIDAIPQASVQRTEFVAQLTFNIAIALKTELTRIQVIELAAGSVVASVVFVDPIPGGDERTGAQLSRALLLQANDKNSDLYKQQVTSLVTGASCESTGCEDPNVDLLNDKIHGVPILAIIVPVMVVVSILTAIAAVVVYRRRRRTRNNRNFEMQSIGSHRTPSAPGASSHIEPSRTTIA